MPLSAAATRTALDAIPAKTVATAGPVVTVTLKFKGVAYDPVAVYDALDAAYGTVATDRDSLGSAQHGSGTLDFTISP